MSNNFIGLKRIGQNKKAMEPVSVKEQLRAMGHFFEIDPKKVSYYIRQLELSGKI
jgi:hypothetical protein